MFARQLLLLLVLPCSASATEGGCASGEPASCGQADGDASDAKVVMLQSSVGLQPGCSGSEERDAARCGGQAADGDANTAEVFMLQSSMGLSAEENNSQVETELATLDSVSASSVSVNVSAAGPGSSGCPCIGITYKSGEINVTFGSQNSTFPASMGSSCQLWDYNRHPDCMGKNAPAKDPSWCLQKWCFVDPCNCNLPEMPKISAYLPAAKIQDKHVYYSYEACGETDDWTENKHDDACVNQKTTAECFAKPKCSWTLTKGCIGKELAGSMCSNFLLKDAGVWGQSGCPCVGVDGTEGYVDADITVGNSTNTYQYPSEIGATCKAWDDGNHPSCQGSEPRPSWCKNKWCLVDPCKCNMKTPPKLSTYFVGAKWIGHQVYYSYAACGASDDYTALHNPNSCVNQKDRASCDAQGSRCLWTIRDLNYVCVGADLGNLCYGGAAPNSHSERASLVFGVASLLAVVGLSLF